MAHNGNATVDDGGSVPPVPGILAMADCFEPASDNQMLIDLAISCAAAMGTDVTILDLRDLELPEYIEVADPVDLPQGAYAFRQLLCAHDGFLIALPSQTGGYPPLLLNAIAWSVCPAFGEESVSAYSGKCASLMSATGESEALQRTLMELRQELARLGVLVLPDVLIIPAGPATEDSGNLLSPDMEMRLEMQMQAFIGTIRWAQSHAPAES